MYPIEPNLGDPQYKGIHLAGHHESRTGAEMVLLLVGLIFLPVVYPLMMPLYGNGISRNSRCR